MIFCFCSLKSIGVVFEREISLFPYLRFSYAWMLVVRKNVNDGKLDFFFNFGLVGQFVHSQERKLEKVPISSIPCPAVSIAKKVVSG
jgi:hypothetical protein